MEGKKNSDEKQVENVFTAESSEKQQTLSVLPSYVKSYSTTRIESTTFEYSWKIEQFKLVCKIIDTLCSAPFPENGKYMIQMNIIRKSESPNEVKLVRNSNTSNIYCNSCGTNRSFYCNYCRNSNNLRTEEKYWPESLSVVQFYIRTNTPFSGSCTVMNPPKSVHSKSVSGHIKDMTLLMETSYLDQIYQLTNTFKIHCKFEIFHTITNEAIHMNIPLTLYSEDVNFEDLTLDQFESENGNSIKFIIDKEQHVIPKKLLYATNSNYFKNICLTYKEDEKELTNELKRNNEVQAFKYLLLFIINGSIKQVQDNYDMLKKLLTTADRYDVSALRLTCEHYLLRYITIENVVELIKLAFSSNAKFLESHSATFFKLYKNDVVNTKEFQNLSPEDSCKIMELIENSKICETSTSEFSLIPTCEKY